MATLSNHNKRSGIEIAVIGMSGKFPGANNIEEFWKILEEGLETISFFTDEELAAEGIPSKTLNNPNYVKAKGIIKDTEFFDESFFNYTPFEAEVMDAQIRIFHEISWEALENAGYDPETFEGLIGVFSGATPNFSWEVWTQYSDSGNKVGAMGVRTLSDKDFLSTLVSYKLNLTGPSFTLYTACSTSLVTIDLACKSLLTHECDMALAGGVTAKIPVKRGYYYQKGMIYSRDGHCRTFDAGASGTVFGNGAGVVVLKRLDDSLRDRDNILAVILGSSINNDGLSKVGYTAPSMKGQAAAIRATLKLAQVEPESIGYIEAHGTGTELGDPIEIEGLKLAFNTDKRGFCAIGSVKTNVGHLDCASGVAGFIKAVLALQNRKIPPSLNYETPNPKIDFENSPFYVATELKELTNGKLPLRVGVNSFGIGGTNAHAILEEAQPVEVSSAGQLWKLLVFSARSLTALDRMAENFVAFLKKNPETNLADAAYTLQVGRRAFNQRRMLVCRDIDNAVDILSDPASDKVFTSLARGEDLPVVFMFPGQGSQYINMGLELYRTEEAFRRQVDRCFEILEPIMGLDIKEYLYPSENTADVKEQINQTRITQPVIFVIEYALAMLLMEWGIKPRSMVGHSIGEYVAACLAGVLPLEDALGLVALRGELMQELPTGSMLSVPVSEKVLRPLLNDDVSLAAVNGPSLCVVSGPHQALDVFAGMLKEKGFESKRLHTSHAFHSMMMDAILDRFEEQVRKLTLKPPQIPYISNVSGNWITQEEVTDPRYWSRHIRQTVRFSDGLAELLKEEKGIFIEVGPGQVLSTFVKQYSEKEPKPLVTNLIRHPKNDISDRYFLIQKIGMMWCWGKKINWQASYSSEQRYRIPLPTYPFERQRYTIQESTIQRIKQLEEKPAEKMEDMADWFYLLSWKRVELPVMLGSQSSPNSRWLLLADESGLGEELMNLLEQEGHDVSLVRRGEQFKKESNQFFTVNPAKAEDLDTLLDELKQQDRMPQSIVHLWLFSKVDGDRSELKQDELEQAQELGFYSLLSLAQACGRKGPDEEIKITVVTNNMQSITGERIYYPENATILGPVRVIPKEYPNLSCCNIDFFIPETGNWRDEEILAQLMDEITSQSRERIIAYRHNIRWSQIQEPVRWENPDEKIPRLREKGVYLITGGLGGIGFVLAEHLARTVKAKLILTGRSSIPERKEWSEWLDSHDEYDGVSEKINKVRQLEELGSEVEVLQADVSKLEQMQQAVDQSLQKHGRIHGVIHTAGLPDAGLIQRRTVEMSEKVFSPKVMGAFVLDRVLGNIELDFLVLCSSVIAVLAPAGQVAYCAANNFLDTFAVYRSSQHSRNSQNGNLTVSIGWDGWKEVGILADMVKRRSGKSSTPPSETRKLDHFLYDKYIYRKPDQEIFISHFKVDRFWFLHEHKILGNVVMLGAAYVEMAAAAFEEHVGEGMMEIRDVFFISPMVLRENEKKEVRLVMKKRGEGYEFVILSLNNTGSEKWRAHARGELRAVAVETPKKYNLEELKAECNKSELIVKPEENRPYAGGYIQVSQRWNNLRHAYFGDQQGLAEFAMLEQYADDFNNYKLHPALMDYAVSFLASQVRQEGERYLPFSYKRITVKRPLPARIFSFVRHVENDGSSSREQLSFNVTLMDEQGQEVVEIEEFSVLTVADRGKAIVEEVKQKYPLSAVWEGDDTSSTKEKKLKSGNLQDENLKLGLLSSEGIEVFNRILSGNYPHVVVSAQDLTARIERQMKAFKAAAAGPKNGDKEASSVKRSRQDQKVEYMAPVNEVEQKLADILQEFLGIDRVGVNDNFFEMGGDSLKAINITARIKKEFSVEIQFAEFFNMPTIRALAGYIQGKVSVAEDIQEAPLRPVEKREYYPLSPVQQRIYVLQQIDKENMAYNEVMKLNLGMVLETAQADEYFGKLVQRHETLRTSFILVDGEPKQRILDEVRIPVEENAVHDGDLSKLAADFITPFDLEKPPLFKLMLVRLPENQTLLMAVMHHIIIDAYSVEIFTRDLVNMIMENELRPFRIQYKDYAVWMNTPQKKEVLHQQEEYWLTQFKGEIPVLNLPFDHERPALPSYRGDSITFKIDKEDLARLREIAVEEGKTLYTVLMSIYNVFLSKISGQEDIIVGTTITTRDRDELSDIAGIFVNTVAIRTLPSGEKSFEQFWSEVQEQAGAMFKNQDYQFEDLIEKLSLKRDGSRNPLFNVAFTLENMEMAFLNQFGGKLEPYATENKISKFDFTLYVIEEPKDMTFTFEFSTDLFNLEKIERFVTYFKEILSTIVKNREIKLRDIRMTHDIMEARAVVPQSDFVFKN